MGRATTEDEKGSFYTQLQGENGGENLATNDAKLTNHLGTAMREKRRPGKNVHQYVGESWNSTEIRERT